MTHPASLFLLSASFFLSLQSYADHFIPCETLIENALKTQDDLLRLNGDIDLARAQQSLGPEKKAPELRMSYSQESNVDTENQSDQYPEQNYNLGLRFFPTNPWEAKAMEMGSDALISFVQASYAIAKNELVSEILSLVKEIEFRRQNIDLLDETKEIQAHRIIYLESLVESNQITVDKLLAAKTKRIETSVDYANEASKLSSCMRKLEERCGMALDADLRIVSEDLISQQIKSPPLTQEALKRYLCHHIQIKRLEAQEKMSEADLKQAQALKIPWFDHVQISHSVKEEWGYDDETSIQFALSIPVFSWAQKKDRIPQQKLTNIRLRKRNLREKLGQQIESAFQDMQMKISELQAFETEMKSLEKGLNDLLKSNESHLAISDDTDIQSQLIEIRRSRNKLRYTCTQSILSYQRLLPPTL